jgi:4-amino-4-deoxy-L-arabinose transferase-like glycosyltransferase
MQNPDNAVQDEASILTSKNWIPYLIVLLVAGVIYLGCIVSPPSQMDDVDAVMAQIARNMLASGDWVTARLDGVVFLEKPPLYYWPMIISYKIFGVHDWSARIPFALAGVGVAWLTTAFGTWAFGRLAGLYAGLCVATCVGLFLFTRVLIPDVMLTFTIALAMWAFLRTLDEAERRPRLWAFILAACLGTGLLLKSLIGVIFPIAAGTIYLILTKELFAARTWKRLRPVSGLFIVLLIAAPWHILAALRNPPYFAWTLHSGPGEYHGFLWFFFINEQLLRFLNMRYPRDYNTVPRLYFWLMQLLWLFPWSVYFPAIARLSFKPVDRAGRTRLIALCWTGFLLLFFTLSTTQEYYSMPCYPALALLLGSAMAMGGDWVRRGTRLLAVITGCAGFAAVAILIAVRHVPAPGDIAGALSQHPSAYTFSLGHMEDLTLASFAYLRLPLGIATVAFLVGALGSARWINQRAFLAAALMMMLFFQAARLALVVFDPYLSSRSLGEALLQAPEGRVIVDHHYFDFSSVLFYANRDALLLNGLRQNMEYGASAPGAPPVFIDDVKFTRLWLTPNRWYVVADKTAMPRFESLVGPEQLNVVRFSGGKVVLTNHPFPGTSLASSRPFTLIGTK